MQGYTYRKPIQMHEPELIEIDLPCSRCASSLRGTPRDGQCPECGMDNNKSLSVAVYRCDDPDQLQRIKLGLDAQTWGTVLALLGAVVGPLLWNRGVSFDGFAFVVAVGLSTVAATVLGRSETNRREGTAGALNLAAIAIGSGAMVVPAMALRTLSSSHSFETAMLVFLLVGAMFWFAGECSKLHLLEECARLVPGREIVMRARHVRWGTYAAVALLAAAAAPAALTSLHSAAHLNVQFMLMMSVTLLIITLLTAVLTGRMSAALEQQLSFAVAIRTTLRAPEPRLLPNEPDWVIEPDPFC